LKRQKEVDNNDKLIVGVNIFKSEPETETPLGVQRIPERSAARQIEEVKALKRGRDNAKLIKAIDELRRDAEAGKNTIPAMIEATDAMATTAELLGTVREVFGYSYDPMGVVESPFK